MAVRSRRRSTWPAGGTRVVLVQHGTPDLVSADWPSPGLLAGWHANLDHLKVFLDGGDWVRDRVTTEAELAERYRQHMPDYPEPAQ